MIEEIKKIAEYIEFFELLTSGEFGGRVIFEGKDKENQLVFDAKYRAINLDSFLFESREWLKDER